MFLPRVERGRDPIREHAVRAIAAVPGWGKQRRMCRRVAPGHDWGPAPTGQIERSGHPDRVRFARGRGRCHPDRRV